jgi:hypothetical protein
MKKTPYSALVGLSVLLVVALAACDILDPQPTLTPIYVTATPEFIIVTNTFTPAPTPVLAPTLPDAVAANATSLPATPTATRMITLTPTFTPTPTDTPITPGAPLFVPVGGVGGAAVSGPCSNPPQGGFNTIYSGNTSLAAQLSCPIDPSVGVASAHQTFERGSMVWISTVGTSGQPGIYVLYANNTYQRFADTWRDGIDPASTGLQAPTGLQEPIRGFGKVWRESGGVRDGLGWATTPETGGTGFVQVFERGEMLYVTQTGQTYILITGAPGTWTAVSVPY